MTTDELRGRFTKSFGHLYAQFLLISFEFPRCVCPLCHQDTIRRLWVADPTFKLGTSFWAKWYLWCESCMQGIYCPPGSYRVPDGESYVRYGDEKAIREALPRNLTLIKPMMKDGQSSYPGTN